MSKYAVAVMILYAVCAAAPDADVIDTNICALVEQPRHFDRKKVRVRAQLISGVHGAALLDDQCKNAGVALWIARDARNHPDFQALDDILHHHGNLGTSDKTIIGTFTGGFSRKQKITGTHKYTMVLEAQKVEKIDVKYDKSQ